MNRAAIDLPWHDVVVDAVGIIDASLCDPAGLERNAGELQRVRDDLHQATVEYQAEHRHLNVDELGQELVDALGYLNEGLRLLPLERHHFHIAHSILIPLRDRAITY